ncbi:uncharacterized protein PV09_05360 [Verruconis gallopava]|uniref:C2H2-type domain-containing protein n=1 Tax=Verruconis gallopava TaxID=253628 RepID=A0A0D1YSL1_9PEZI|nr:uncharacterized protein PV09_05360 [Verruconis gallopava]KIW03607.1 hypothetical protein PV09_05360 [Verruconis gallopava]
MAASKKIKCTFENCNEYFETSKEMKKHKKYATHHEYCHICDIDFKDWSTATAHKSQMSGMDIYRKTRKQYQREKDQGIFWSNREKFGKDYGELKFHKYFCKFCGAESHTESARQRHTLQVHPIDQGIKCPGCEETFPRAAGLVYHLEEGHCKKISATEFKGFRQHKTMVNKLLQDPSLLSEILSKDMYSFIDAACDHAKEGGVSLLDIKDDDITWDEEVLLPDVPVIKPSMPLEQQTWPALHSAVSNLSIKENISGTTEVGSRKATDGSMKLLAATKASPVANEWQEKQRVIYNEGRSSNILTFQFWNPAHPDYDPNRFWDPLIEKHRCPFPNCEKLFEVSLDCHRHIDKEHMLKKIRCPLCFKVFKSHHALIEHVERSSKCAIKHSRKFGQTLDEFSGGFLSHTIAAHPDLKAEDDGYEVGYVKFKSTVPTGWEKREQVTVSTMI